MRQLIYRSRPFGFDTSMLAGILMTARRNNRRDGITGALICREDIYLQLVEGPAGPIEALYARIQADDRHLDVRLLLRDDVVDPMFPGWAMLDDEAPSLFWSAIAVANCAIEAAGPVALREAFARLPSRLPSEQGCWPLRKRELRSVS